MKIEDKKEAIKKINDKIEAFVSETLLASGAAFFVDGEMGSTDEPDENSTISMDLESYRENGRTLTDAGRKELAAEENAVCSVVDFAEKLGFEVSENGDGSGQYGSIQCFKLSC